MKLWPFPILLVIPLEASPGDFLSYDDSEPDTVLTVRETLAGPVTASIMAGPEYEDDNLFEPSEIYLRIEGADEAWWVHTPEPYDSMEIIQFINDSHLLLALTTPASTATVVFNLGDRSLYRTGSGIGEAISGISDEPLIRLNGQMVYSDDVYRYSSITDLQGRVIEFLSSGETCLPISEIVTDEADLSRLQQPLDYCVGISQ
ncbi:hypothetical protein [Pseudohongiella sp. O18]|uniref:hypothetical protein n=1 Tax=Pseudohongiella sp. O18 TaxID=2904248 RepID=UPI001F300B83|nr:hypothetical protein [Pseudohongiella sp. O18]